MSGAQNVQLGIEAGLRALIAEIVRGEVRRAIADALRPDEYLTTVAAAAVASVAPATIRRWVREGRLAGHRSGRAVRVQRAELERLLTSGPPRDDADMTPEQRAARDFG